MPTPIRAMEPATVPRRPSEETARLGDEIYDRAIRHRVEAEHHGKIVAIDVDSGDYTVADTGLAASERLRKLRPDADVWCLRIGYGVLRHFGGRPLRIAK